MNALKSCPFCGGEAHTIESARYGKSWGVRCECGAFLGFYATEAEAIAAWNSRAAMEFDNWFYLPKPKEPIVEVTETTHAWDGTKVKTDVFYQVQEQAAINWAKELDEHIIKRICEVWNSRAEYGTLTAEQVRKAAKSNSRIYKSPVDDGIWIKEYDWQAIADELNSRAERTCKIESSYLNDFTNKYECWYEFEMQCGYKFTWDEMEPPNYCPNCGCKVVK